MPKRIEVEVEGARATYVLRDDLAPRTAAALWDALPIEGPIRHGKLSGEACFFEADGGGLAELPETPELGVTSIYQGFMVVFPNPTRRRAELLLSYGLAEYRWPTGRRYVTPVAELEGSGAALFDVLRRMFDEGRKTVTVRRATP
jgi:hypothetical protein